MYIRKLTTCLLNDQEEAEHRSKYGGYNYKPPNWKELTSEQFACSDFFTYDFETYEFRQFKDPEHNDGYNGLISVRLYYMPAGHGYGIYSNWTDKKVRYFRFGCEHKYEELDVVECRRRNIPHYGRCWHVLQCQKCNHLHSYDSSD